MNLLIAKLIELTPDPVLKALRGKNRFRGLKNFLIMDNGKFKMTKVKVDRDYYDHSVSFEFIAPIETALKAKRKGIESTLLRHSIKLLSKLKDQSNLVVYDVGANYGFLSLVWGKISASAGGKVYSFEPSPTVSLVTEKNFSINNMENIEFHKKAIGNMNGSIDLYDGKTSSNVLQKKDFKPVKVDIVSLDEFTRNRGIDRIDLIKIDVDGIEYDILQGAKEILNKHKPILIVETNNDDRIIEYFLSLNYAVLDMELKEVADTATIPANVFCFDRNSRALFDS